MSLVWLVCDMGLPCPTLMTRLLIVTSSVELADKWIGRGHHFVEPQAISFCPWPVGFLSSIFIYCLCSESVCVQWNIYWVTQNPRIQNFIGSCISINAQNTRLKLLTGQDMYCQISSISCTKSKNLNVSRLILQLSWRMLQLHLSDQKICYHLRCILH